MDALAAIGAVSAQLSPAKAAEIDRKAQDFEAMVLSQLLKADVRQRQDASPHGRRRPRR